MEGGVVSVFWTGRGLLARNLGSKQLWEAFQVSLPIPNSKGTHNFLLSPL